MNPQIASPKIVIAGASGYIGKALIPHLLQRFPNAQITALSRSAQKQDDPRVTWKACELFSLKSLEAALPPEVELAVYLVHSMGPTAQLDQGSFADYDLILADNFARALDKVGLKQLIYLGGLIPQTANLSLHLRSRLEVEETFRQYKHAMTAFRAGLILGDAGSSSQILIKLVRRLPVMICPAWTQTLTAPVDLETVLKSITEAALQEDRFNQVYDLAGCQPLTYLEMMKETARRIGKRRFFFKVPFFTPTLSRLWVSLITNTPRALVYPLVESLEHAMLTREDHLFSREWTKKTYGQLLEDVTLRTKSKQSLFKFRPSGRTVRSVQRLPLPAGKNAEWVKQLYLEWLPRFMAPFIKITTENSLVRFSILTKKLTLLELKTSDERSNPDRQLLYIVGGLLVANKSRGRLEFRVVLNRKFTLAAIHDYTPALPWFVYKYTQAKLHLLVMRCFGRKIKRMA